MTAADAAWTMTLPALPGVRLRVRVLPGDEPAAEVSGEALDAGDAAGASGGDVRREAREALREVLLRAGLRAETRRWGRTSLRAALLDSRGERDAAGARRGLPRLAEELDAAWEREADSSA